LAPGHYQVVLPISALGDYRVDILEERSGRKIGFPPIGYTLPYNNSSELPRPEFNTQLLSRLAQSTGGEINPKPSVHTVNTDIINKSYEPLRQPFIILTFCLFLLEVAVRKFLFVKPD